MNRTVSTLLYLSFIALGIPSALIGAGWPAMHADTGIPFGYLGFIQMMFAGLPILSSYLSGLFMNRYGIARDMIAGMGLLALALLAFSIFPSLWGIVLSAVILGFGYGVLNTGLNTFAAQNFGSHHVAWLHSFWGIGAMVGPLILSFLLAAGFSWRAGFRVSGILQTFLILALLFTLPLWETGEKTEEAAKKSKKEAFGLRDYIRMKGSLPALALFFLYGGIEACFALWGASFLFKTRGMSAADSASWTSVFFACVTAGRMLAGFFSLKFSDRSVIRSALVLILTGVLLLLVGSTLTFTLAGVLLIGLGSAPVFPTLIHDSPRRFSRTHAGAVMGIQMTVAALGNMFLPFLFGLIAGVEDSEHIYLLPYYILMNLTLFMVFFRRLYRKERP